MRAWDGASTRGLGIGRAIVPLLATPSVLIGVGDVVFDDLPSPA